MDTQTLRPANGVAPRDPAAGATFSLALYVPNVDDVVTRAVAAGATLRGRSSSPLRARERAFI
jgi:PhnB protein